MADRLSIDTTAGFWFSLSAMVLLLPLPWVWAVVFSSLVHEMFHIIALYVMGVRPFRIHMKTFGIYLETDFMTPYQELIAALAGPLGALSLLIFRPWLPKTAVCVMLQSAFHLLPIFPLDGGRALRSWTKYIGLDSGNLLCKKIEGATWILLFGALLCISVLLRTAIILLSIGLLVALRTLREKYLANQGGKGYNICTKI